MLKKLSTRQHGELRKKLILEEKELVGRVEELKADDPFLNPDHVNDNAAVDTDVREQMGHDTLEAQITALEKKLELMRSAMKKMIKGTYGNCENCTLPIMFARLQLIPETRYCIDCEKKLVK